MRRSELDNAILQNKTKFPESKTENSNNTPSTGTEPSQNPASIILSATTAEINYYKNKANREQKQALDDVNVAIRIDPKVPGHYTTRAEIYANRGDLEKAIADLTEVIRLDPQLADAYERRGKLYSEKHDHDKAAADFAQACG